MSMILASLTWGLPLCSLKRAEGPDACIPCIPAACSCFVQRTLQAGETSSKRRCPPSNSGIKSDLDFSSTGHLSQFFAFFPRASPLSASIGPPGPCTTLCLSTVSTHSPFIQIQGHSQADLSSWSLYQRLGSTERWCQCLPQSTAWACWHLWDAQHKAGWRNSPSRVPKQSLNAFCFRMSK